MSRPVAPVPSPVGRRGTPTGTRRNTAILLGTAVVTAALLRYPTSTHGSVAQPAAPGAVPPGAPAPAPGATAPGATAPGATAPGATAPGPDSRTVDGPAVETGYGPIQVRLTIRGSRILTAIAADYPHGTGPSRSINRQAVPVLQAETVSAQSARVDAVSGATYTSAGYVSSLQAALDAAHLG